MCIFCDLQKFAAAENDLAYFIYDKYPKSEGHSLIIPKRHIETVFDATGEEWKAMGELINIAKAEIIKNHKPAGYNLLVNCGKAAGQEVMHAHIHLIPRYLSSDKIQ
jgi:diadenosine tetraphosphate (Ap4A) HIT family hydrolase